MSKARFPIGQMTTSYDGCCGVLFRERKGDVYCITLHYSRSFSVVESLLPPPLWFLHEFSESSGRRPDSRLGRRGEKLAESRKVGKWESREIAISEISWFFMDFLIGKNAKIWDFWRILEFSEKIEKSKGGPLKSWIFAFFQIRKSMKNREISEITISRLSHFPTFLLSASFFPPAPQPRIWAAAAWSEMIDRH